MEERDRMRGCEGERKRKRKKHCGAERTTTDGWERGGGGGGSRISSGFSTSFLQSVRLMRIRRPRLHPPASKSKAFAKVVTFRRGRRGKDRENARNEEEQADRRTGREIPRRR